MRKALLCFLSMLLLGVGACEPDPDQLLAIEADGVLWTQVYLDRNGDDEFTASTDAPVSGVRVSLSQGGASLVLSDTTDSLGVVRLGDVPVGHYSVSLDPASVGDTLEVGRIESPFASVAAHDSMIVRAMLSYHTATLAEARTAPEGRLIEIEGVALHASNLFGDSTLSISDSTGALRITRFPREILVPQGLRARFVGRTGVVRGVPVLMSPAIYPLGTAALPEPDTVTTAVAATADGGALDARLVIIRNALIIESTLTADGNRELEVDDGSGVLEVLLSRNTGIRTEVPLVPGVSLTATGVLEPARDEPRWMLMPRTSADIDARAP